MSFSCNFSIIINFNLIITWFATRDRFDGKTSDWHTNTHSLTGFLTNTHWLVHRVKTNNQPFAATMAELQRFQKLRQTRMTMIKMAATDRLITIKRRKCFLNIVNWFIDNDYAMEKRFVCWFKYNLKDKLEKMKRWNNENTISLKLVWIFETQRN